MDGPLDSIRSPGLLAALMANLIGFWRDYGCAPGAELHESADLMWFATGFSSPALNRVLRLNLRPCRALADVLSRVGDKWTIFVVGLLSERSTRFNELRRTVGAISQRMLTLTLKGLERDGLVTRTVYPTTPPRVDYELTELGRTLIDPLKTLHAWSTENRAPIETARLRYDSAQKRKAAPKPRARPSAVGSGVIAGR